MGEAGADGQGLGAMTLPDYLRVIREQWILLVGAVVLLMIVAMLVSFVRSPVYTSTITLYVSAQPEDGTESAYEGAQLSQQRVTSYVELVKSARVSGEVVDGLDLSVSPTELAQRVDASSAPDSVFIDVGVSAGSPAHAARLANAVGRAFTSVVDDIERPLRQDGTAPVAVRVVQPAVAPSEPSSLGWLSYLVLGVLGGLVFGAAAALTRNAVDKRVKSKHQLREVSEAPVLATIPYNRATPRRPLTVHEDAESVRTERFRELRTNLGFVNIDSPPKVVTVTSAVSHEGKTNTVCNLAIALGAAGVRTLVIDADLRRPGVADLLGIEGAVGLTSVLTRRSLSVQAIQPWHAGRFDVLTSGPLPPNPSELLTSRHMHDLLTLTLRARYDVILIDTPPLLPVVDAAVVAQATDGALVCCRYRKTSSKSLEETVRRIGAVGCPVLGSVLTLGPSAGQRNYTSYSEFRTAGTISGVLHQNGPNATVPVRNGTAGLGYSESAARNGKPRNSDLPMK